MPQWVNKSAKEAARKADLYNFLITCHPDTIIKEGRSLRLCCNHSVSVKYGYSGYTDFATGDTGNSIDFLVNYLGYGFQEAVAALCASIGTNLPEPGRSPCHPQAQSLVAPAVKSHPPGQPASMLSIPEMAQGQFRQLFAYLYRIRRIPTEVIQRLVTDRVLYQEQSHANMVFINPEKTFMELRGSNSFKPFHQVACSDPTAFWWFKSGSLSSSPEAAFVCESAIDAISLYCLHESRQERSRNFLYCSIGGVANQKRIDRIKAGMGAAGLPAVIAVDNDQAGECCRQRNSDCAAIVPVRKDWNEDWAAQA